MNAFTCDAYYKDQKAWTAIDDRIRKGELLAKPSGCTYVNPCKSWSEMRARVHVRGKSLLELGVTTFLPD